MFLINGMPMRKVLRIARRKTEAAKLRSATRFVLGCDTVPYTPHVDGAYVERFWDAHNLLKVHHMLMAVSASSDRHARFREATVRRHTKVSALAQKRGFRQLRSLDVDAPEVRLEPTWCGSPKRAARNVEEMSQAKMRKVLAKMRKDWRRSQS